MGTYRRTPAPTCDPQKSESLGTTPGLTAENRFRTERKTSMRTVIPIPTQVKPVQHRVLTEARAVGVWGSCFTRLERLLVSQAGRQPTELDDRELAARVAAVRECDSVLARQRELQGGSL
jgi:hypothetical protein